MRITDSDIEGVGGLLGAGEDAQHSRSIEQYMHILLEQSVSADHGVCTVIRIEAIEQSFQHIMRYEETSGSLESKYPSRAVTACCFISEISHVPGTPHSTPLRHLFLVALDHHGFPF
jgi:hypothetical protein